MTEMGNPFQEESGDLLVLDTKNIADADMVELVKTHHQRGMDQFQAFRESLETGQEGVFYQPFKKNKMSFFRSKQVAGNNKERTLKEDCQLFSRLFISCQNRECDLQEFFRHENQSTPASLSDNGKIHTTQKSQLAEILQKQVIMPEKQPDANCIIIDGSAFVNAVSPKSPKTFDAYVQEDIIPKIESYGTKYGRVDVVFDVYKKDSLKAETRRNRGRSIRRRVTSNSKTPKNWKHFLRDSTNKTELFEFLADKICRVGSIRSGTVVATRGPLAITNSTNNSLDGVSPCSQEEADTRLFIHARDAALNGSKSIIIKANDTDVLIIAVSVLSSLQDLGLQQMWIFFGQGLNSRWIPVHDIVSAIGPQKTLGMLFFHAFTGCDVVSAFRGKDKKSAWLTWDVCKESVS